MVSKQLLFEKLFFLKLLSITHPLLNLLEPMKIHLEKGVKVAKINVTYYFVLATKAYLNTVVNYNMHSTKKKLTDCGSTTVFLLTWREG